MLQDCGVGPDGLAYSAWNSEGGADTLCLLSQDMACDISPALSFNDSLTAFLKKGNLAEDLEEVIRAPEATRPLGLRNSDNKIVAATCNRQWRRKLNDVVCSIQRGFCWSRQMLENIVDVDSLARILGCEGYKAFIALFDFCCAFPSLGHVFLFAMLKAKGFPEGFICIVKQLYRHCCSFGSSGNVCQFLWFVTCGVLQGCPLSGLIFSVMMDPFCVAFLKFETRCNSEAKRPLTCIRAFADDVGAVIHSLKSLIHIKGIFDAAAKYANLSLKLVKCYLVPVFCVCDEKTRAAVKKWLRVNIPEWADIVVKDAAEYLGFFVGPSANKYQLANVKAKWKARNCAICDTHASCNVSLFAYNVYSHSLWGFKSQLMHIADDVIKLELSSLHALCSLPFCALGPSGAFFLKEMGNTSARSLAVMNISALCRTANKTISGWRDWLPLILKAAETHVHLRPDGTYQFSLPCWDADPFAVNLSLYDFASESSWQHLCNLPRHHIPYGIAGALPALPKWLAKKKKNKLPLHTKSQLKELLSENKVQKHVYNTLLPLLCPFAWQNLIKTRVVSFDLRNNLGFAHIKSFTEFNFDGLIEVCAGLRPFVVSHVLRTLLNGWVTTSRIAAGKTLKSCVFGCSHEKDHLAHYIACPVLWKHLEVLLDIDGRAPWEHLGLSLQPKVLISISFASYVYHAVRSNSISPDIFLRLARAYNAISHNSLDFKVQKYSSFLSNHPLHCSSMGVHAPPFGIAEATPDTTIDSGPLFVAAASAPAAAAAAACFSTPSAPTIGEEARLSGEDAVDEECSFFDVFNSDPSDNWESLVIDALGFLP